MTQTPVPVTITGAQGRNAGTINGTYDPAEGSTGGQPHYLKRGPGDRWLAYCASDKTWYVTIGGENKGTTSGIAFIKSDPPRLPHLTPGPWQVADGTQWAEQAVRVSEVSPPLVGAVAVGGACYVAMTPPLPLSLSLSLSLSLPPQHDGPSAEEEEEARVEEERRLRQAS